MLHYFLVASLLLISTIIFYYMVVVDDRKNKEALDKKIHNGEIQYVWLNGIMVKIDGFITDTILTITMIGSEGDSPSFYCNIKDIKKEVLIKDLQACGILLDESTTN